MKGYMEDIKKKHPCVKGTGFGYLFDEKEIHMISFQRQEVKDCLESLSFNKPLKETHL
jgi:hypothetical protein